MNCSENLKRWFYLFFIVNALFRKAKKALLVFLQKGVELIITAALIITIMKKTQLNLHKLKPTLHSMEINNGEVYKWLLYKESNNNKMIY